MPDGVVVEMPDKPSPDQLARLRALDTPAPSKTESVISGAAQGAARGFDDEVISALRATFDPTVQGDKWGNKYDAAIQQYREQQELAEKTNPMSYLAGDIGGSVIGPAKFLMTPGAGLGRRIWQGSKIGGAEAGVRAAGDTDGGVGERLSKAGPASVIGAGVGALGSSVFEAGSAGLRFVRDVWRTTTEKGQKKILRENIQKHIPEGIHQEVIDALANARSYVKGSEPTAGDAVAHIPGASYIAALEKKLEGSTTILGEGEGAISAALTTRAFKREAARVAALEGEAGNKAALEAAIAARRARGNADYKAVRDDLIPTKDVTKGRPLSASESSAASEAAGVPVYKIDPTVVTDKVIGELSSRPSWKQAVGRAVKLAEERGETFPEGEAAAYTVGQLQHIKLAFDDLIRGTQTTSLSRAEEAATRSTLGEFKKWLGSKSPGWEKAREEWAVRSHEIARMEVGQKLQNKLTNPASGVERGKSFMTAVENEAREIKKTLGGSYYKTLDDVDPALARVAKDIASDLGRDDAAKKLASSMNLSGGHISAQPRFPNVLSPGVAWANRVLRHGSETAEDKINAIAARLVLNPSKASKFLAEVPPPSRKKVIDALMWHMFISPAAQQSVKLPLLQSSEPVPE